jgi:hypothetical protein
MRRPSVKKITLALTISSLAVTLTACSGAGPNASTRLIKQVTDGVEAKVLTDGYDLRIVNTLLVATEDGSAVVVGTMVNSTATPDTLLGIYAGGTQAKISGTTTLDQNQPLIFEGESATTKAVFAGVGATPGKHVTVTFAFARAGKVSVDVIIRDKRDDYANVTA